MALRLEIPGAKPIEATSPVHLQFSPVQEEDLRWYLEDYLRWPEEPAPGRASVIAGRIEEWGSRFFEEVFQRTGPAHSLWLTVRPRLADVRIEIVVENPRAAAFPWELIREPGGRPLCVSAAAFVRVLPGKTDDPEGGGTKPRELLRPLQILLVICRPERESDVPFRSVAAHLLRSLTASPVRNFQLELLRPATFPRLQARLEQAAAEGRPFDIVHFDGHGVYADLAARFSSRPERRPSGYLLFEHPDGEQKEYVDGRRLGGCLAQCGVPVLLLNACRSDHVDSRIRRASRGGDPSPGVALGSLAATVVAAGVPAVLAMRYRIYVPAASRLVADLYSALARGRTLGEAVTAGRRCLYDDPWRPLTAQARALWDWPVPVIYETRPIVLADAARIAESVYEGQEQEGQSLLPGPPAESFVGRDATILAIDRAFDRGNLVLVHGGVGSGKTATAVEFARWYIATAGIDGKVLFTAFSERTVGKDPLDEMAGAFSAELEREGIVWESLSAETRREAVLDLLRRHAVLWIWDGLEKARSQQDLAPFFAAARHTLGRFLLTSRRDEGHWLGNLPIRVRVPSLSFEERLLFLRKQVASGGPEIASLETWSPILTASEGNPWVLGVLATLALRAGIRTAWEADAFVERFRAGELEPEELENVERIAALRQAVAGSFSEPERRRLATLTLFCRFVGSQTWCWMADPDQAWCLPDLAGLTREAAEEMLSRLETLGLVTGYDNGYYLLHPLLLHLLSEDFHRFYAPRRESVLSAFCEVFGQLGETSFQLYHEGERHVISLLRAEEENLLAARRLALEQGWWKLALDAMQGLGVFYLHAGRQGEWQILLEEVVPSCTGASTDGPLAGRELYWSLLTHHRIRLAREQRNWVEAERLLRLLQEWEQTRAAPLLTLDPEQLDGDQRNAIRNWAGSLLDLGEILREQGNAACMEILGSAFHWLRHIRDDSVAPLVALSLGHACEDVPAVRDLDAAEGWYRKCLELAPEGDRLLRARGFAGLGHVAWNRIQEAVLRDAEPNTVLHEAEDAINHYHDALRLTPGAFPSDRATYHNALGAIYNVFRQFDRGLEHLSEAVRCEEQRGNIYGAALTKLNMAQAFLRSGRTEPARLYAEAALEVLDPQGTQEDLVRARQILAALEASSPRRDRDDAPADPPPSP